MPGRNSLREERGLFWLTVAVYHGEGGEGERVCLFAGAANTCSPGAAQETRQKNLEADDLLLLARSYLIKMKIL